MSYAIPQCLPHLSNADAEKLCRLLELRFANEIGDANRWLGSELYDFRCKPVDLLKRDEIGVLRVISYLEHEVG